ncbi:MAG: hypothetical protein ACREQ4_07155 [Candidatus Binataceae bacterium]
MERQSVQTLWLSLLTPTQTLLQTFQDAVNAYNGRDWATLEAMLDQYALLKTVADGDPPQFGRTNVRNYLEADANRDNPTFTPDNNSNVVVPHHVDHRFGYITGTADWVDKNGKGPIHFSFTFINRGPANAPGWKLFVLWSSVD